MRLPRITIKRIMIAVAAIAVDCYLVMRIDVGVLLPTIALNVGLILVLRQKTKGRGFWVGFETVGLLTLGIYAWLNAGDTTFVAQWPTAVINSVVERLPSSVQMTVFLWLDNNFLILQDAAIGSYVFESIIFESTIGLPMVLHSVLGGWIWKKIRPRPIMHFGSVATHSPSGEPVGSSIVEE